MSAKKRAEERYWETPNRVRDALKSGKLNGRRFGILGYLISITDFQTHVAIVSLQTIADELELPANQTLRDDLRKLREAGWIDYESAPGQRKAYTITITGALVWRSESEQTSRPPHGVLTKSGPSSREVANGSGEVVGELDEEVDSRAYRVLKKTSGFYAASSAEGSGEVAGEVEIEEKRRDVEEKTRDLEDPPTTNVSQLRSGSGVWVVSGVDPESGKRFSDQFRDRVDAEEHALDVAGLGAVDIRVEERVG